VDGAVEVGAIDDAVVGVGGARGDKQRRHWHARAIQLDCAGVVAEALDEIVLQGDLFFGGYFLDQFHQLAIRVFAEAVEHDTGSAADRFEAGVGLVAGRVVGDPDFEGDAEVRIDDVRGCGGAAHFDAAFFLNGCRVENLIRVRLAFQAAHGFDHGDAADTV